VSAFSCWHDAISYNKFAHVFHEKKMGRYQKPIRDKETLAKEKTREGEEHLSLFTSEISWGNNEMNFSRYQSS